MIWSDLAALAFDREIGDTNGLGSVFFTHSLDLIAIPAEIGYSMAAIVGWPIVTVPIGYYGKGTGKEGQPIGLVFIARPWGERILIRAMGAFEENFEKRRVPSQLS
jgi:amidase